MKIEIVQVFRSSILEHGFKIVNSDSHHPCAYQFGSVVVENGNEVRFCPSLRYGDDHIFNISQKEISENSYINNVNFNKFSRLSLNDLPCKHCRYKYISHGGCRANSISYNYRLYSKDPICCSMAPFIEEKIIPLLPPDLQMQYKAAIYSEGMLPDDIL